jgi:hypothetical protein
LDKEQPSTRHLISLSSDSQKDEISVLKNELRSMMTEISGMKAELTDIKECLMGIGEFLKEEVNFNLGELIYQFQQLS